MADDFVVTGAGQTSEEATQDHDQNLDAFLQRCKEKNLKLNDKKMKLRMPEVPFIGHIIVGMPPPSDVTAVQRLEGLAQYLSKFLPHLSDITKKDVAWTWGPHNNRHWRSSRKLCPSHQSSDTITYKKSHCSVSVRSRSSTITEWSACHLCLQGTHSH